MIEHAAWAIPSGIADSERDLGYVVGAQSFIYCLDLENGEVQAQTDFAGTPLTLYRGALVGWRAAPGPTNAVWLFAARRQGTHLARQWETRLELPKWVEIDSLEADWFTLNAEIESEMAVVTWEGRSHYRGGAPPPPHVEQAQTHGERHILYLDPSTGNLVRPERVEQRFPRAHAPPEMPPDRQVVPYRSGSAWATHAWQVDSADTFLVQAVQEPGVLLRRQNAGEVRLTRAPSVEVIVTPDGKRVFVRESEDGDPAWHIFSAETGEQIARLPFDPGTQELALVNDRVLYMVVETRGTTLCKLLRCRSLGMAELLWSYPLSEVTRTAPPPLRP